MCIRDRSPPPQLLQMFLQSTSMSISHFHQPTHLTFLLFKQPTHPPKTLYHLLQLARISHFLLPPFLHCKQLVRKVNRHFPLVIDEGVGQFVVFDVVRLTEDTQSLFFVLSDHCLPVSDGHVDLSSRLVFVFFCPVYLAVEHSSN